MLRQHLKTGVIKLNYKSHNKASSEIQDLKKKKMKDVVIIANFVDLSKESNNRFLYLANLIAQDNSVELITSDFDHTKKKFRTLQNQTWPFKLTMLHELGYPKNVCLRRFLSHIMWGINVKKYLGGREKPDIIYCAVPSLTAALNAEKYCKRDHIKFVIDIQDLWPEAFEMVFHVPVLSNLIFMPFKIIANKIYKSADQIVAVSHTYADRAMRVNKKCKKPVVVYLGTDKEYFDQCASHPEENRRLNNILIENDIIRIAYVGTLGRSYDITLVLQVIRELSREVQSHIQFIIMGDGPEQKQLKQHAKGLSIIFTGRLPYPDMVWLLTRCDIAVNPIVKGAAQSITNKQMDYAMAGIPVINTQECDEYRELITKYKCGINCKCGDVNDVQKALLMLINNPISRNSMGKNARKMAEELFDRADSYKKLAQLIS